MCYSFKLCALNSREGLTELCFSIRTEMSFYCLMVFFFFLIVFIGAVIYILHFDFVMSLLFFKLQSTFRQCLILIYVDGQVSRLYCTRKSCKYSEFC